MNSAEIRTKFKSYLGDEELFRKFVAHVNKTRKNRLLYKQELRWNDFRDKYLEREYSFDEIREIFRVCELHGIELIRGSCNAFRGEIDYSSEYESELLNSFPNTKPQQVMVPPAFEGEKIDIWYCTECIKVNKEYSENRITKRST